MPYGKVATRAHTHPHTHTLTHTTYGKVVAHDEFLFLGVGTPS